MYNQKFNSKKKITFGDYIMKKAAISFIVLVLFSIILLSSNAYPQENNNGELSIP
jgi:hypothetical protein